MEGQSPVMYGGMLCVCVCKVVRNLSDESKISEIIEDENNNGFKYYLEKPKYPKVIVVIGEKGTLGYCLECKKFISNDTSDIRKHINAVHKTFEEKIQELEKKL